MKIFFDKNLLKVLESQEFDTPDVEWIKKNIGSWVDVSAEMSEESLAGWIANGVFDGCEKKYSYVELLEGLDGIFADYGNNDLEWPDNIRESTNGNFDLLTECQAQEVFEYNGGNVMATTEYLEGDE